MKVFTSTCTIPPEGSGFVWGPLARGSLNIVWSCLSTLVICTWSILHPNVPTQSEAKTKKQQLSRRIIRTFWKFMWMLFNIIAFEWPLGKAVSDLLSVGSTEKRFVALKRAKDDSCSWTRQNMHFANKGGFAIRFSQSDLDARETPDTATTATEQVEHSRHGPDPTECVRSDTSQGLLFPETPSTNVLDDIELGNQEASQSPAVPDDSGLTDTEQRGQLPVYTRKPLSWIPSQSRKLLRPFFPAISPERLQERTEQKARRIGPIKWALSTKNKEGVNIALKTATTESFDSEWEQKRFLHMPQQWVRNLAPLAGDLWVLDANQLLDAWDLGIISELPNLSEDDLADRNKGDLVVKYIAVLQVFWFMAQFFSRFRAHLPVTQLEILTLSYAVCTPFTFYLLLEQTKDVQYSLTIQAKRYATPQELMRLAIIGPTDIGLPRTSIWIPNTCIHAKLDGEPFSTVTYRAGVASFALLVLGALHCLAWGYEFPSDVEQFYWNAASLLTAVIFPVWFVLDRLLSVTTVKIRQIINRRISPRVNTNELKRGLAPLRVREIKRATFVIGFYFVVVRLYIIVEVVRTLAFQPPEAFTTSTWWSSVPHIG